MKGETPGITSQESNDIKKDAGGIWYASQVWGMITGYCFGAIGLNKLGDWLFKKKQAEAVKALKPETYTGAFKEQIKTTKGKAIVGAGALLAAGTVAVAGYGAYKAFQGCKNDNTGSSDSSAPKKSQSRGGKSKKRSSSSPKAEV